MPILALLGIFWASMMFIMVPKFSDQPYTKPKIDFIQALKDILSNRQLNILNIIAMLKSLIQTSCSILLPFLWKSMNYSKFQIGLAMFCFLFLGGISSLLSPKFEKKIGTRNVFYISMIMTLPMMIAFMLTYKTYPAMSFVIYVLMGFVTMFATPITMSMAQKVLPQYKSIIGGFINGFSWGIVAIAMSIIGYIAQATSIVPVLVAIATIPAICSVMVKYIKVED
jgi:MFS family permease